MSNFYNSDKFVLLNVTILKHYSRTEWVFGKMCDSNFSFEPDDAIDATLFALAVLHYPGDETDVLLTTGCNRSNISFA